MSSNVTIAWQRETGQLTFAATGVSQIELLAVFRLCEHALIRQLTGGVGRPPEPTAAPSGGLRSPGLVARQVDR